MSIIKNRLKAIGKNKDENEDKIHRDMTPDEFQTSRKFTKEIENFWYHNKTWVIMGVCILLIVSLGFYLWPRKGKGDLTVSVLTYGSLLAEQTESLHESLNIYTPDFNIDGEKLVDLRVIPVYENIIWSDYAQESKNTIFNTQQQQKIALTISEPSIAIYILDQIMYDNISKTLRFEDLSIKYPDSDKIIEDKLILKKTALGKALNTQGVETGDLYICVRQLDYVKDKDKQDISNIYKNAERLIDILIKTNP